MRTLLSFAALFLSILLVQLGSGTLGPLDALSGTTETLGFTTVEIGWLGSAHFGGFFAGCILAPRLIGAVGHVRAFSAAAALGAVGALMHPVLPDPVAWSGLRVLTGMAVAISYTVVESWLQAKITSATRGRVFGIYRIVDLAGALAAQGLIAVLEPAHYVSYNLVAMFCCLSLLPLALARGKPPVVRTAPRLSPIATFRLVPTAVAAIIVAGLTAPAFRMVGPVVAEGSGLDNEEIALFLALAVVGGAAAQVPVGWLADKMDRRWLLVAISLMAAAVCTVTGFALGPGDVTGYLVSSLVFGMSTFTLYSVAAAYANDWSPPDFMVELNASLLFYFSLGAIASPLVTAILVERFGPDAMYHFIAVAHLVLIGFSLYRMTRRRAALRAGPYRYLPRTSMTVARLAKEAGSGVDAPRQAGLAGTVAEDAPPPEDARWEDVNRSDGAAPAPKKSDQP